MTKPHSEDKKQYWELPVEELPDYIVENWAIDDDLDVGDALHRYYEETRCPREWTEINALTIDIWNRMFQENIEPDSPAYGVIVSGIAASAGAVWHTVADAFGLDAGTVETVLDDWYEVEPGEPVPPPITWDEFMRRYRKEEAEWAALQAEWAARKGKL